MDGQHGGALVRSGEEAGAMGEVKVTLEGRIGRQPLIGRRQERRGCWEGKGVKSDRPAGSEQVSRPD